jgi:signal transduction histidine kinase/ligand-binding sensor domain-containing protein/CheY-like chemotaxis protein/AraC-like DNA-binding protein
MHKRTVLIFVIIVFSHLHGFTQEQFYFDKINTEKGLSNNTVNCISQDSAGNMWFGTYDGLNCWDGEHITVYKHDIRTPQGSIANNKIEKLYTDRQRNLWILLPNNIISRHNQKTQFTNYDLNPLDRSAILRFDESSNGDFLAITAKNTLKYNAKNNRFTILRQHVTPDTIQKIISKIKSLLPETNIDKYLINASNEIWVSTRDKGLIHLTPNTDGTYTSTSIIQQPKAPYSLSNNEVYDIYSDKYGILWVGTKDGGVNRLLPQAANLKTLCHEPNVTNTLPEGTIRAIGEDNQQNVWIGTYNEGVAIYSKLTGKYHYINHKDNKGMADWDRIRSIYTTSDQSVWIGSYMGLCRVKPDGEKIYYDPGHQPNKLTSGRIYSMAEAPDGYLWIGTWNGIDRFNIKLNRFEHIQLNGLLDSHLRTICVDHSGKIWIGSENGGITIYNPKNENCTFLRNIPDNLNSISNNSIFSIIQDQSGKFWIGTADGLNLYNPDKGKFTHFNVDNGLLSNLILGVLSDREGNIWASTSKGASCINPKTLFIKNFDCSDGWVNNELSEGAYFKSPEGELYFGGNNGINYFHPGQMSKNAIAPDVKIVSVILKGDLIPSPYPSPYLTIGYFSRNGEINLMATHFKSPSKNVIAWRILPNDSLWHYSYSTIAKINLKQLGHGVYHLQYKAANCDGVWSAIYSFPFKINPPFWQTPWFIIVLVLVLSVSILLFTHLRLVDAHKRNKKLEIQVAERTRKIQEQSLLLKRQNDELIAQNNDIIKQKDQILAQRDHLFELHQKLEEESEARASFFTNVSHEIRTPLTLIYGPVENLMSALEPSKDSEQYAMLRMVKEQTDYLLSLVNQTLDFRKLETGHMQLETQTGEIIEFCREITGFFLPEAHQSGISLQLKTDIPALMVVLDFEKTRQILSNLISNALKFTSKDGQIIFEVTANQVEKKLYFTVSDDGIGIPKDRIEFIFDRFYQIGRAVNQTTPGSGIGLSLARELAELHKGHIDVESKVGQGSSFVVTLPLVEEPDKDTDLKVQEELIPLPDSENTAYQNPDAIDQIKSIVLVDDNPKMLSYLSGLLIKHEYKVYTALNGPEALKILKHYNISLILSDWLMPEMDGLEFCTKVKQIKKLRHIPFVILTARLNGNDHVKALQCGADDFITKPFSEKLLINKLSTLLNREKNLLDSFLTKQNITAEDKKEITEDEKLLARIVQTINDNIAKSTFNPDELGDILGISKMKLYRKCKQLGGYAPIELIKMIRIKRSAQLLGQNGYTISEIGYKVGFNDPKYFSRCFQKAYNMTPSQYQEKKNAKKLPDDMLIRD